MIIPGQHIAYCMAKIIITTFRKPFTFKAAKDSFHRRIIQAIPSSPHTHNIRVTFCIYCFYIEHLDLNESADCHHRVVFPEHYAKPSSTPEQYQRLMKVQNR